MGERKKEKHEKGKQKRIQWCGQRENAPIRGVGAQLPPGATHVSVLPKQVYYSVY